MFVRSPSSNSVDTTSSTSSDNVVKRISSTEEPVKFQAPILKLAAGRVVDWLAYVPFFTRVAEAEATVRVFALTAEAGALNDPSESTRCAFEDPAIIFARIVSAASSAPVPSLS